MGESRCTGTRPHLTIAAAAVAAAPKATLIVGGEADAKGAILPPVRLTDRLSGAPARRHRARVSRARGPSSWLGAPVVAPQMRASLRRRLSPIQRKSQSKSQTRQVSTQVAVPACCARGRVINVKEKKRERRERGAAASVPRRDGRASLWRPWRLLLPWLVGGRAAAVAPLLESHPAMERRSSQQSEATERTSHRPHLRRSSDRSPDEAPPRRPSARRSSAAGLVPSSLTRRHLLAPQPAGLASLYDGGGAHGGSFESA